MPPAPISRPSTSKSFNLAPRAPQGICPRTLLYAVEKWGKTTLATLAPNPVIIMARGETGYLTLLGAGLVKSLPAPLVESWPDLMALLDQLAERPTFQTIALDAISGFERLLFDHVCQRDFKGDWGEKGFASYGKGIEVSIAEWILFLQKLDKLNGLGMQILILGHSTTKNFKNPMGEDFDRYVCDCNPKIWAITAKWADALLFGKFNTIVDGADKKGKGGKGIGGTERILYTQKHDAYDAGNRYGMPECFNVPSATTSWQTVWSAMNMNTNKSAAALPPVTED